MVLTVISGMARADATAEFLPDQCRTTEAASVLSMDVCTCSILTCSGIYSIALIARHVDGPDDTIPSMEEELALTDMQDWGACASLEFTVNWPLRMVAVRFLI